MEENKNSTNQSNEHTDNMPQGSGQNSSEHTYWEATNNGQSQEPSQNNQGQSQNNIEMNQQYSETQQQYINPQPYTDNTEQYPGMSGQYQNQQYQGQYQQYTNQQQYQGQQQFQGQQQYQSQQQFQGQQQYQSQPQFQGQQQYQSQQQFQGQYQQYMGSQQTSEPATSAGTVPSRQGAPETPEQFYSYYQQQMTGNVSDPPYNNSQPYQSAGTYPKVPKKKSHGKLIAAVIIIVILLSGAATAYAFRDKVMNTFAQMTKSPAEYYAYVEKTAIKDSVDRMKPYLNLTSENTAFDITTDVSLNRDTLNSLLEEATGSTLEDLESQIGLSIENFGANIFFGSKDGIVNEIMGLRFNQVDLITMELFADTAKQEIFLRLPELSKAYMEVSQTDEESISSEDLEKLKALNSELFVNLINRYGNTIVDNVKDVEMDKNSKLTLDSITNSCTKLTVTISQDDANKIAIAVLETAKTDKDIIELLPIFDLTQDQYEDALEDAKEALEDSSDELGDDSVKMIVYVNDQGEIIGREFSANNSDAAFGYTYLTKDDKNEYEYYLKDDNGDKIFKLNGSQTKKNDAYDGSATIELTDPTQEYFTTISAELEYEDIRTQIRNNHVYHYGSFTLSSLDLLGIQLTAEYSVEDDNQNSKIVFQMGASPLVTINTKMKYLKDFEVEMPSKDAEVYDISQSAEYEATMDLEGYISKLSEKLGIDLQGLIDSFQSDDYYDYEGSFENYDIYDDSLEDYDESLEEEDYDNSLEDFDLFDDTLSDTNETLDDYDILSDALDNYNDTLDSYDEILDDLYEDSAE